MIQKKPGNRLFAVNETLAQRSHGRKLGTYRWYVNYVEFRIRRGNWFNFHGTTGQEDGDEADPGVQEA
jgi:hypothetical protein